MPTFEIVHHNRAPANQNPQSWTHRSSLQQSLFETVGLATGTTRMVYDGDHLAEEYNEYGTRLRRYFWGNRNDEPVLWSEGTTLDCANGAIKFLHADRSGSIIASADCWGNFKRAWRYDEYGIPQSSDSSLLKPSEGARFLYTGQAFIPDAGLYYYKARMYSPTLGRFLQTDPIGYEDQINLYAYVANDPVNDKDPSGMCSLCVGFIVGVGVEATVQYIKNGKVDLSARGIRQLAIAGTAGALGGGISAGVAKITANIGVRAAANGAAGATIAPAQTAANARMSGQDVTAGQLTKSAIAGAAGGFMGSAAADGIKGGARVLAEKTGLNIVTRAGQVATPEATSTRDTMVRSTATVVGHAAGNAPSIGEATQSKICSDASSGACD